MFLPGIIFRPSSRLACRQSPSSSPHSTHFSFLCSGEAVASSLLVPAGLAPCISLRFIDPNLILKQPGVRLHRAYVRYIVSQYFRFARILLVDSSYHSLGKFDASCKDATVICPPSLCTAPVISSPHQAFGQVIEGPLVLHMLAKTFLPSVHQLVDIRAF